MNNYFLIIFLLGLFSGILAGLLGIGGGAVLVPLLIAFHSQDSHYQPTNAVATSLFAIVITSLSGSIQNWRMGVLDFKKVISLAIPSLMTVQFGAYLADIVPDYILLSSFAILLMTTIFLTQLKQNLATRNNPEKLTQNLSNVKIILSYLGIGSSAGLLAGFFGVGGGVIMVPLQLLLLGEKIKTAIQTSLAVIVITSIGGCIAHTLRGNVIFHEGLLLGIGGLIGAQVSTRFLPKLPDKIVSFLFRGFLACLSTYMLWKAWNIIHNS